MYGKMQALGLTLDSCIHLSCACVPSAQLCPTFVSYGLWPTRGSLFMGFSRKEYLSGLPCPPPGTLPDPGIQLESLLSALQVDFTAEPPRLNPVSLLSNASVCSCSFCLVTTKIWVALSTWCECDGWLLLASPSSSSAITLVSNSICWIPGTVPFWEASFTLRGRKC